MCFQKIPKHILQCMFDFSIFLYITQMGAYDILSMIAPQHSILFNDEIEYHGQIYVVYSV